MAKAYHLRFQQVKPVDFFFPNGDRFLKTQILPVNYFPFTTKNSMFMTIAEEPRDGEG